MKQGEAVYLTTSPDQRGNISLVGPDWFDVTWQPFVACRPETLAFHMVDGFKRTRVRYSKNGIGVIGFGVPDK